MDEKAFWLKDNKIIVNDNVKPILCDHNPCEENYFCIINGFTNEYNIFNGTWPLTRGSDSSYHHFSYLTDSLLALIIRKQYEQYINIGGGLQNDDWTIKYVIQLTQAVPIGSLSTTIRIWDWNHKLPNQTGQISWNCVFTDSLFE